MKQKTLLAIAASGSGLFVAALVALMVSVYMDTPRAAPFNADFSLLDDRGRPVDKSVFKGRPSLVYFGYTHCPQACPTTLLEVSEWLNALGEDGRPLRALFFSIDPERDTQAVMHQYVNAFGDRITGVTGSLNDIRKVSQGWFIHAEKEPSENGDYHMNHTVDLLLIGADGRLKGLIPYGSDRDEALAKIREVLLDHRSGA
ncbi:SCO family protein [Neorhizobium lilium]|uniref:SCO family protein n=1 Tax=Neorhizobium lilium TaxID=2503024 RepID=A0A3S3U3C6_9HYPH|nr:SCO family protein [Neorhizobium lilium]RWX81029.1 SCO family protein [Neorhizobium lilium]